MHADRGRLQRVLAIILIARRRTDPDKVGEDEETIGDVLHEYERRWSASKDSTFTLTPLGVSAARAPKRDAVLGRHSVQAAVR